MNPSLRNSLAMGRHIYLLFLEVENVFKFKIIIFVDKDYNFFDLNNTRDSLVGVGTELNEFVVKNSLARNRNLAMRGRGSRGSYRPRANKPYKDSAKQQTAAHLKTNDTTMPSNQRVCINPEILRRYKTTTSTTTTSNGLNNHHHT